MKLTDVRNNLVDIFGSPSICKRLPISFLCNLKWLFYRKSVSNLDYSSAASVLEEDSFDVIDFLRILIFNILLAVADTLTDFTQVSSQTDNIEIWHSKTKSIFQGFSLIFDEVTFLPRFSTIRYGIIMILASWLPFVVSAVFLFESVRKCSR